MNHPKCNDSEENFREQMAFLGPEATYTFHANCVTEGCGHQKHYSSGKCQCCAFEANRQNR